MISSKDMGFRIFKGCDTSQGSEKKLLRKSKGFITGSIRLVYALVYFRGKGREEVI